MKSFLNDMLAPPHLCDDQRQQIKGGSPLCPGVCDDNFYRVDPPLSPVEDRLQVQAVAPVLVKVSVQRYRMLGIAVQNQPRGQSGAADGLSVLDHDAGGLHLEADGVPRSLADPAVFEAVQVAGFFPGVCPEAGKGRGRLPDGQPSGILIGVGRHGGGEK